MMNSSSSLYDMNGCLSAATSSASRSLTACMLCRHNTTAQRQEQVTRRTVNVMQLKSLSAFNDRVECAAAASNC
jgi:hypothetical protein